MRRLGQGLAIAVALFATVATSHRRWAVEAPSPTPMVDNVDAADPTGEFRLRIDASPEFAARKPAAHWQLGLRGTARWEGASPTATSSVLHLEYEGLLGWNGNVSAPTADVVLRPGETVEFEANSPWDLECAALCRFVIGAQYRWEQPDGNVEIVWSPHATASGTLHRRDAGPTSAAKLSITGIQ